MVGIAERHFQVFDEPVGKIGGGGVAGPRGLFHGFQIGCHVLDHAGHRGEAEGEALQRVERAFLVLLHILGIGERQALHDDEQAGERADDAARFGADEFSGIGIALLRHDRRAGGEFVGQSDEAELRRRPDDDFLGKAGQMHG